MMQILTRLRLTSKRSGIPFLSLRGLRMDWWMRHGVCCRMLLSVFFVQWLDLAMARLERSARLLQSILVATRRQQLRNLCSCAGCADCSGRSFNDGAGCKVLDHLHLCCVCLQLYIPPSEITKHSMQLPSTYEPLHCCSSCACICMFISLCRYRVLIFFLYFLFHIYINIHLNLFIYIYLSLSLHMYFIYAYICILVSLSLCGTLAHVLRPNFHRCSSFTSHCRSFTSLPQKRLRRHARAFHFLACFQVQLTYFHIHVTFSFRSSPK